MLVYLQIAQRLRPRWLLWENVPGVLSANGGRDFGALLGGLSELGYGWAYRVLDCQYVRTRRFPRAIPQRRRRVFLVAHCLERSAGDWLRPSKVLFDAESLSGHLAPQRQAPKGIAADAPRRAGRTIEEVNDINVCVSGTIAARFGNARNNPEECVAVQGTVINRDKGGPFGSGALTDGSMYALTRSDRHAVAFNDTAATLKGGSGARGYPDPSDGNGHSMVGTAMTVRRLTNRECERLQGFPDDYTLIPWRGKPAEQCPDGPRYKALGNSMATNCMEWIGERIRLIDSGGA